MNLFEIIVNIIEMFISLSFLTLYFGKKYKGIKGVAFFLLSLTLSVAVITYLNLICTYEGFLGLIFILIYFLYSKFFLKGNVYTKLFISGFLNCIIYFIALLSNLIVNIIFSDLDAQIYRTTVDRWILIILSKLLLIVACAVLLKLKINNIAKKRDMAVLIIMPVAAEISMVGIMQVFLNHSELKYELLLASVSVMIANILTYYVFIKINNEMETETQIRLLEQKYENDKKYTQEVEKLYSKTCDIRHDLIKHFETIFGLLEGEDTNARQYVKSVINNQLNQIKGLVKTDNAFFDAISNVKVAVCEKYGIKAKIRVMNHALDNLQPDEIGIIFGNLFDNAIDAAKTTKEKQIELDVQKQDNRCSILMLNSIDESVLKNNEKLETSKINKENHGLGIKNIRKIVKSHDGMINFFEENNYFGCDILI